MPYYSVIEGEGVAGPATTVSAETTALSSCMGIVFHNPATNTAGLYHYGADTLNQPAVQNTITQMINYITPTNVYVTAPPIAANWGAPGSTKQDRNAVDLFLMKLTVDDGTTVQWMPDRTWSNYRLVNGVFTVNHAHNVGGGVQGAQLGGNAIFYGGQ